MKSCKGVVGLSLLMTAMAAIGLPASANLEVSTGRKSAEVRLLARLRRSDPVGGGHHRQMHAGSAASSPRREKRARYPWINVVFLQSRKRF